MSEFHVEVAILKKVSKHPNADVLSMGEVNGYPVIFRTEDFKEGDKVVHIPIDSIVPNTPEWEFLGGNTRIKAKRLRGIFSMGLPIKARPEWKVGQNVQEELGIIKYEPPISIITGSENERDPGFMPVYTDIEGMRRWMEILQEGEEVVITEKIHGANGRFLYRDDRLWVGSHTQIKRKSYEYTARVKLPWVPHWLYVRPLKWLLGRKVKRWTPESIWWEVAISMNLEERLKAIPNIAIYGEVYGQVQDLKYGVDRGAKLVVFDAMDTLTRKYLDYDELEKLVKSLDLATVPILYRGPWKKELVSLAEGKSTVPGANNVREGIVVRPVKERVDLKGKTVLVYDEVQQKKVEKLQVLGRVVLKFVGEGYLLRKEA